MADTFTQENRLISIETPLGHDALLLRSFVGSEGISRLFHFRLDLMSEDLNIDFDRIIGQNVNVAIRLADPSLQRYFNGHVSKFVQLPGEGRLARYQADMVPWLWFLTRTADCRIFQNKSVPDIVQDVFRDFGFLDFENQLQGTYQPWEYCVQYRETAFNFVSRLLEQEGIFFFFRHENGKHVLVMADSLLAHRSCPNMSSARYEHVLGRGYDREEDVVLEWRAGQEMRPGKYALNDFNFETPGTGLVSNVNSRIDQGGNQRFEVYDYPGEYLTRDRGDALARLRMEEQELPHAVVDGESNCRAFSPGFRFELTEHERPDQNGQYVLTSVTHSAQSGSFYSSNAGEGAAYANTFACTPFSVPFCPPRVTPKPLVQGPQTAMVVGAPGEEIHTDIYGRVKVQFHWDRRGIYDEKSSCFIRVSQPWAGWNWGQMWMPRIGQEVVVDFLEGDPDRPIITGRVYNGAQMPPYELPAHQTISTMKSHSSPGGGGFNELRFEDKKHGEQVFIHSQKRMDVRVLGSMYETNHANRHMVVGWENGTESGGDLEILVKGDNDIHVKEGRFEAVDKQLNLAVTKDVVHDFQANHATLVTGKAELNAREVIIEASQKIGLKVGGNFITIDSSGITMNGTMMKLNSGGWGAETGDPDVQDPYDAATSDTGEPGYLDRVRGGGGGTRHRNVRTVRSQHARFSAPRGEDPRMTAMRNVLQDSAAGRHALDVMQRYQIPTVFDSSNGYYYSQERNTMVMDPTMDPNFQTTGVVHEMNHGEAFQEGRSPDVHTATRDEYVNGMLREEAHGDALANEASWQLSDNGHDMSSSDPQSGDAYQRGYDQGVREAYAANHDAPWEDVDAAGRQAGEQSVLEEYRAGRVRTSSRGNPRYTDYYDGAWHEAHPGEPWAAGDPWIRGLR